MAPSRGALPNLIVIGAQKCGTSALHYYLDMHPQISMSVPKELNFFSYDPDLLHKPAAREPVERYIAGSGDLSTWERGVDWYRDQFRADAQVRGESSTSYTAPLYSEQAAERMAGLVPEAKLLFAARDPLEQIVSAWLHFRAAGSETRALHDAVTDPHGVYVERARYHARLKPYLERFGADQILVLGQEELLCDRRATLARTFSFLGVDETFWSPRMQRERHVSRNKTRRARAVTWLQRHSPAGSQAVRALPQEAKWWIERLAGTGRRIVERPRLDQGTRARIAGWLAEDIAAFRATTGMAFERWSI